MQWTDSRCCAVRRPSGDLVGLAAMGEGLAQVIADTDVLRQSPPPARACGPSLRLVGCIRASTYRPHNSAYRPNEPAEDLQGCVHAECVQQQMRDSREHEEQDRPWERIIGVE